jgi:hypothetical protein
MPGNVEAPKPQDETFSKAFEMRDERYAALLPGGITGGSRTIHEKDLG